MKAASKLLLGLTVVFAVALLAQAAEGEKKEAPKEKVVTLKGTLACGKCVLKLEGCKKCTNAIVIKSKKTGKDVTVIFIDKGGKEPYHGKICTAKLPGSVTGVLSKKGDKYFITPKGEDAVKFD